MITHKGTVDPTQASRAIEMNEIEELIKLNTYDGQLEVKRWQETVAEQGDIRF